MPSQSPNAFQTPPTSLSPKSLSLSSLTSLRAVKTPPNFPPWNSSSPFSLQPNNSKNPLNKSSTTCHYPIPSPFVSFQISFLVGHFPHAKPMGSLGLFSMAWGSCQWQFRNPLLSTHPKYHWKRIPMPASTSSPLHFPGLEKIPFVLTFDDLPDGINSPSRDDPFSRFLAEAGESEMNSWGVVVNSFLEMEASYVSVESSPSG
ncbi:hypothetical protein Acr_00g0091630 [Actinidia rufa]|uniref:Uncharacterized protein n=1 Tax=Actinidia rufa TaxID=165716 RepID=A0A7J0DXG6_9ERIC|nr:hypothetical protein Acr_00g0091630 [Actinidia rufa]